MPDAIRGNFVTNRPDILTAPVHLAKHIGQSVWQGLKSLCMAQPSRAVSPGIRPEGRKPVEGDPALPNLQAAKPIHLSSHESFRDLPMLTPFQAIEARKYFACANISFGGSELPSIDSARVDDAFGYKHPDRLLVPESIRSSTVRQNGNFTRLIDSSTGLAASISFDSENNELIVGFSGVGFSKPGSGIVLNQVLSCAVQWLGLIPKNMRQGSKIVALMKEHVEELNRGLPDERKVKLTVSGFSMGGGVASYAALKNEVPAVVFNPMRLGLGARARVGQNILAKADRYLTEVVVPGDWVSDNGMSHLYKLNPLTWGGVILDSTGRLGSARRLLLPVERWLTGNDRHTAVGSGLDSLIQGAEQRDFLLPSTSSHWDETRTDKERAALAIQPINELAGRMRVEFPGHFGEIDALVETLNGVGMPLELRTLLSECGHVEAIAGLLHSELRSLKGIAKARELLIRLPRTSLLEALGKDLRRLETELSRRILEIQQKILQLANDSLAQFAVDRGHRESEDLHGGFSGMALTQSELFTLDTTLAYLRMADDALLTADREVIDGLEDQMHRGAVVMHALQRELEQRADHIVTIAARNGLPGKFARDLELCQDAEDAQQLTSVALMQARDVSRVSVGLQRHLAESPIRTRLGEALGNLESKWLARALASTGKGVDHAETLMRELDARIAQVGEHPGDRALRANLAQVARRLQETLDHVRQNMRVLDEFPLLLRRLQPLGRWSREQVEQVLT